MHQAYEVVMYPKPLQLYIPAGVTNGVLIDMVGTQNSAYIKYESGGSLVLIGSTTPGVTFSGAQLATLYAGNEFYKFGSSEFLTFNGPARFYLAAVNATVTCYLIRGLNE